MRAKFGYTSNGTANLSSKIVHEQYYLLADYVCKESDGLFSAGKNVEKDVK